MTREKVYRMLHKKSDSKTTCSHVIPKHMKSKQIPKTERHNIQTVTRGKSKNNTRLPKPNSLLGSQAAYIQIVKIPSLIQILSKLTSCSYGAQFHI